MANTAKGDAMKRSLNIPNTPAKKLKQAKLPFQPISSPRAPQVVSTNQDSKLSKLVPKIILHRVQTPPSQQNVSETNNKSGVSKCKENKNPDENKCVLDSTSQLKKAGIFSKTVKENKFICDVVDLTEGESREAIINTSENQETCVDTIETENDDQELDRELTVLTPDIGLEESEGTLIVDEEQKLEVVFSDDECVIIDETTVENTKEAMCDTKVKNETVATVQKVQNENVDSANECKLETKSITNNNNAKEKKNPQRQNKINIEDNVGTAKDEVIVPDEKVNEQNDSTAVINNFVAQTSEIQRAVSESESEHCSLEEKSAGEDKDSSSFSDSSPPAKRKKTSSEGTEEICHDAILKPNSEELKLKQKAQKQEKVLQRLQKQRKREEKKQEEVAKKLEEKQEKEKKKLEKKQEEEKRKLEKKLEEEKKKLERKQQLEEQKKQKQLVIDEKNKAKQEKKLQKELLLKEKEAEKERTEQIQKKQEDKLKAVFANFFVKKDVAVVNEELEGLPAHFQVKDVRLAPLHRNFSANSVELVNNLDKYLNAQESSDLFLNELKNRRIAPRNSVATWPCSDVDVKIICSDEQKNANRLLKRKYLKFSENVRPPYCGTWSKRSKYVGPRRPWAKDDVLLNYEVDSDDEWEEEPGESLSQSEGENESDDNYEVDNDVFVPHGYLSDGEGDEENKQEISPEALKVKLKMKEMEFEKEMKKKCVPIKPIIVGCIWAADSNASELEEYASICLVDAPIETKFTLTDVMRYSGNTPPKKKSSISSGADAMLSAIELPWFIKLVHGNQHNQQIIFKEFQEFWSRGILEIKDSGIEPNQTFVPSKSVLRRTLKRIAKWGKFSQSGPMFNEMGYSVTSEYLNKYNLENISLPNRWNYHITLENNSLPSSHNLVENSASTAH